MNEQGLGGFGGGRGAMQGHGREVMALLQHHHQRRRQLEEEVRRQMFAGVAAFLVALGHGQQVYYGEDAGGLGDSDAGGSEPEPPPERTHGGSGSKRSRAAEVHNLSEKVVPLPFLEMTDFFFLAVLCFLLSASAKDRCLVLLAFGRRGGGARSTRR
jgi:hypothetical protein